MAKQAYHHGDLKNNLLTVAEALLEEKGAAAISLREVAKLAGVSHTAPYRHFSDKHALLCALGQIGYIRLAQAMQDSVQQARDEPLQQLRLGFNAYVRHATAHPEMAHLMFGGTLYPFESNAELKQSASLAFEGLLQIIRNGQAAGLYVEQPTQILATAVWSQAHGLAMLATGKQMGELTQTELTKMTEESLELLLNGLKKN